MKKFIKIIVGLFIFIPFIDVDALNCYSGDIDVSKTTNFKCTGISGDNLTFKDSTTDKDYSSFFKYSINEGETETQISIDKSITFDTNIQKGIVKISDGSSDAFITILNSAYVEPTTTATTTTTTTASINTKTLTVTLDANDGSSKEIKTCTISGDDTTCLVTLPKLSKSTFNGWGTATTCKEGNSGTIKVEKDITYYACYTDNDNTQISEAETILLKTLSLTNKDTEESIDFGTFSIKKTEYSFKVLNEVENINVAASAEEGIVIDVVGNENLQVGENEIKITLKKGDNLTNEYILKVTRLDVGETINNIHYLKSLVVGGYTINFNKDVFIYNLTIPSDVDKLQITAESENGGEPEIIGNEDLVDGSSISINVPGDDEDITVYTINITKESSVNYLLIIAVGVIVLLIIILVILIMVKSNKKKQNLKNNNKPQVLKKEKNQDNVEILNI